MEDKPNSKPPYSIIQLAQIPTFDEFDACSVITAGPWLGSLAKWKYTKKSDVTKRPHKFFMHGTPFLKIFFGGIFSLCSYNIQHCFICRPSDSTVPTDAGIEPRTVATGALAVRRSNHYRLDLIRLTPETICMSLYGLSAADGFKSRG